MKIRIPSRVICIKGYISKMYPGLDFGQVDVEYDVHAILPNGCYYMLRKKHLGPLMGEQGEANHLVNMDRFKPVEWRKF